MQAPQDKRTAAPGAARSPLLFIFLTVFIDLLGFGMVIPLLPIYSKAYGAGETTLGWLFACFSGMQFLFAPMWGRLSDRVGRRPVLIGGLVGTAASYVLFAFANSLPLLFVARLAAGFFGGNISTAQAYIADVTTPENRAKGMGLIGAAFGLGFTLGPWMGGELTHMSIHAPGLAAAALSSCAALFGYLKLPEPVRARGSGASRTFSLSQVGGALREPRLGTLLVLSSLSILAFSAFEAMFARYGLARFPTWFGQSQAIEKASFDEVMAAAPITGRYLGGIGILSAIIQGGIIRRLLPRYGEIALSLVGLAILGISLGVVGLAPSFGVAVVGCALMPLGFGLNTPSLNGLISRAAPAAEQGAYLGLNQSMASLARTLGPPGAGYLFQHWGPGSPFLAAACVLAVATLVMLRYRTRFGASFARASSAAGAPS